MIKTHMKGRLGAVVEVGITEGLRTKSVYLTEGGAVVLEQTNIHPQIWLITGGRQDFCNRYRLPLF